LIDFQATGRFTGRIDVSHISPINDLVGWSGRFDLGLTHALEAVDLLRLNKQISKPELHMCIQRLRDSEFETLLSPTFRITYGLTSTLRKLEVGCAVLGHMFDGVAAAEMCSQCGFSSHEDLDWDQICVVLSIYRSQGWLGTIEKDHVQTLFSKFSFDGRIDRTGIWKAFRELGHPTHPVMHQDLIDTIDIAGIGTLDSVGFLKLVRMTADSDFADVENLFCTLAEDSTIGDREHVLNHGFLTLRQAAGAIMTLGYNGEYKSSQELNEWVVAACRERNINKDRIYFYDFIGLKQDLRDCRRRFIREHYSFTPSEVHQFEKQFLVFADGEGSVSTLLVSASRMNKVITDRFESSLRHDAQGVLQAEFHRLLGGDSSKKGVGFNTFLQLLETGLSHEIHRYIMREEKMVRESGFPRLHVRELRKVFLQSASAEGRLSLQDAAQLIHQVGSISSENRTSFRTVLKDYTASLEGAETRPQPSLDFPELMTVLRELSSAGVLS